MSDEENVEKSDAGKEDASPSVNITMSAVVLIVFLWTLVAGFGAFLILWADSFPTYALSVPTIIYGAVVIGLIRITGKLTS